MILTHGINSLKRGGGDETVTIGGRAYPVVEINGVKWMAENLDYKWDGLLFEDGYSDDPAGCYYNNDEDTYGVDGNRYGLLYNLSASVYLRNNISELAPGCRFPTDADWDQLFSVGWPNLKSKTGWPTGYNGTDPFGFNMPPGGTYSWGGFGYVGNFALINVERYRNNWAMYFLRYDESDKGTPNAVNNWYRTSIRLIVNT